jgi:hypothetical protein
VDLGQHGWKDLLAAKARIDGHHQHEIELGHNLVERPATPAFLPRRLISLNVRCR